MNHIQDLKRLIKLTGERAKLDAKANGTYIVYMTNNGQIVKEYTTGEVVKVSLEETTNE